MIESAGKSSESSQGSLADLRQQVAAIIKSHGHERREQPFELSSGGTSRDYVDGKRAIATGQRLAIVGRAFSELAAARGVEFDAAGGPTMGADAIAAAIAMTTGCKYFSVRKQTKEHGRKKRIEGAEILAGERILLVEDVITTGRSMLEALEALRASGASVVLASALVDRGDTASPSFQEQNVPYEPLLTYRDINIDPV